MLFDDSEQSAGFTVYEFIKGFSGCSTKILKFELQKM
jgi:hypothetical protein